MVKIRLSRTGKRNAPSYRIVVADCQKKRDGRIVEKLGFYDPKTEPKTISLDRKRLDYWLSKGAQMSDGVRRLIEKK